MSTNPLPADAETGQEQFERVLSQSPFDGLKAILDRLSPDRAILYSRVKAANAYEELLAGLGYRLTLTRQIHVQDAYSRLGRDGGIRAVVPYYDISTQSALPTLINFDATVTTTAKSVAFFNALLDELKRRLNASP
jgi:hypothetical protein